LNNSLLDLLKNGGYILYARHGEATVGEDQPDLSFQYCYTQRNLSEMGKRQAIYYGEVLHHLQIPVNYPILTSPFCRAVITAQLAFGRGNVQIDPFWVAIYNLGRNISASEQERTLDTLRSKLEKIPPQGTNQVIIAHSFPTGIGLGQIPNMGTVIIKPLGQGNGFEIISKLSLSDLANLSRR
jgi:broad specificity phosphatase PhoE